MGLECNTQKLLNGQQGEKKSEPNKNGSALLYMYVLT